MLGKVRMGEGCFQRRFLVLHEHVAHPRIDQFFLVQMFQVGQEAGCQVSVACPPLHDRES